MKLSLQGILIALSLFEFTRAAAWAAPATIHPGPRWSDTAGEAINAHGGGILQVGAASYWFGEVRNGRGPSQAIKCYRSEDLNHWEFRGAGFTARPRAETGGVSGPDTTSAAIPRSSRTWTACTCRSAGSRRPAIHW